MKKYFQAILLCTLIASFAPSVKADVEDGIRVDSAFVAPLMKWVEGQVGVKVPVLPQVIASRSQFSDVLKGRNGSYAGRPQSAYIPGTVYLNSVSWDPDEPIQVSLLVHELVHHAQLFMKNVSWSCADAKETQAYTLQNRWLAEHGHNPFVQTSWIARVSACPNRGSTVKVAQGGK